MNRPESLHEEGMDSRYLVYYITHISVLRENNQLCVFACVAQGTEQHFVSLPLTLSHICVFINVSV